MPAGLRSLLCLLLLTGCAAPRPKGGQHTPGLTTCVVEGDASHVYKQLADSLSRAGWSRGLSESHASEKRRDDRVIVLRFRTQIGEHLRSHDAPWIVGGEVSRFFAFDKECP